jgi:DNA-binding NtrC family response regulator
VSTILIIDDNQAVCSALEILLSLYDLQALSVNTPEAGLEVLDSRQIDLIIQDMNFSLDTTSGTEGENLFATIRESYPTLPIILLTAWTSLETAVNLVKQGAADYLAKPWDDDKLVTTIRNLLELNRATSALDIKLEEEASQKQLLDGFDLCGTVFESSAMTQVIHLAIQVADSDVPVLITGPNGCGKEKIAEIVHRNSRRVGDMVRTNAGAIPTDLIESELFGSTSGAFTGAKEREGRFSKADNSTLFLDEIGNLPLQGQIKLLRVLQTGAFEKLGSSDTNTVDVRLICATNSDLSAGIAAGSFREDLYYRINVIEIEVPPLNRRPADILPLARHFIGANHTLSRAAEIALVDYYWPGNVRELENCMQRAKLLSQSTVLEIADLGLEQDSPPPGNGCKVELDAAEICRALDRYNGVVSRAAKSLGISRQSLYRRMETHGLKS